MAPVRITDTSYVNVPATAALPTEPIKLTAMEALWVVSPVVQRVLLFEDADMPPFDTIVEYLRSSLAATLVSFAPLAGKLVHLKNSGDVAIACSATDSVRFVVADSDADIRRLVGDELNDLGVLEQLVPQMDMGKLPTPVLAVQATSFEGGVSVRVTVHHSVVDGQALWTFLEAWATACRGETPATTPTFDRSLVNLPGGEELARSTLQKLAPNLPLATPPSAVVQDRSRFTRRTFTLDARDIQRLKQRIIHLGEAHGKPLSRPPSAFAATVALAWTCFARCKTFAADDDLLVFFFANIRHRLDPPVDTGYIGSCLTRCVPCLPARELHGEWAMAAAAVAVQDEITKTNEEPLAEWFFFKPLARGSFNQLMNVSGSTTFRTYQLADFRWGMPRLSLSIQLDHDGQVALERARDGHGVQLSVSLHQSKQMDDFKSHFLNILLA